MELWDGALAYNIPCLVHAFKVANKQEGYEALIEEKNRGRGKKIERMVPCHTDQLRKNEYDQSVILLAPYIF